MRRLTIALGVLILFLYFAGLKILAALPLPPCSEWPKTSLANGRGDRAEISVHGCIFGLFNRQSMLRLRPAGSASAKLVVRFTPKGAPRLNWLDDNHLQADLGEVRAVSPQIDQVGPVHVTFSYSGADPSLN